MFKKQKILKRFFASTKNQINEKEATNLSNFDINNQKSNRFLKYHIPFSKQETKMMLNKVGFKTMKEFQEKQMDKSLFSFENH